MGNFTWAKLDAPPPRPGAIGRDGCLINCAGAMSANGTLQLSRDAELAEVPRLHLVAKVYLITTSAYLSSSPVLSSSANASTRCCSSEPLPQGGRT